MPTVEEDDLLSLFQQIEKAETAQKKMERLLVEKSTELKKNRNSKVFFKVLSVLMLIAFSGFILIYFGKKEVVNRKEKRSQTLEIQQELKDLRIVLEDLEKQKTTQALLNDLSLHQNLMKHDTVFSVQIQTFTQDTIRWISEKYTYSKLYQQDALYKFSLGVFSKLSEAQEFRKVLLRSGIIDKHIFVISYKDGKRIRIENPF